MRISLWAERFGIKVSPAVVAPGQIVYRIVDIFTTRDGSWEPSEKPGSLPLWARDKYLKPTNHPQYNDDGGADVHIFGAVEQPSGELYPYYPFEYWTWPDNSNRNTQRGKRHGWANMPMSRGSGFVPERGERGPWAWKPAAVHADIVTGAGLPANQHVSFWAVWKAETQTEQPVEPDKPTEPSQELTALTARVERLERIIRQWSNYVGDL